jgi:predicted amidohydrolase YtcJ
LTIALINGNVQTLDDTKSSFQALTIEKDIIKMVGSTEEIMKSGLDHQEVIDLKGMTVLPSFVDSHTHIGHSGLEYLWVDLSNTSSTDEILELIMKRTAETPNGEWVVGVMYDDSGWRVQECLTKDTLDMISRNHPIFLRRVCGHYGVVNSKALEYISPEWRYVDRQNGVLLEDPVLGFMKIIKPDMTKRLEGMRKVLPVASSLGITAIREIVNFHSIKAYHDLDKNSELKLRVFGYIIFDDLDDYLQEYPSGLQDTNNFKVVGIKVLLDGSMGARTAALKEPYSDAPDKKGELLYSDSELTTIFEKAKGLELPLMVHAIGDRAIQQFIDIYRVVFGDDLQKYSLVHSIEHVEVLNKDLLNELKELGVWLSMQPNFAGRWSGPGGLNETRLGAERLQWCNAYKTIMDNELPVVFGSDSMPLGPLYGISSAVSHPVNVQGISPDDAIRAYTQNCYKLLRIKSGFGILKPGNKADIVVLSSDPMTDSDIVSIKVVATMFNGEIIYNNGLV